VTETKYLPLLIPCREAEREGSIEGKSVKTLPYRALDLFVKDVGAFEKNYGALASDEIERLAKFLKFAEATRAGSGSRLIEAAKNYLHPSELNQATRNPLAYLQDRVNRIASEAALVLWQERKSKELSAGIFCKDVSIATAVLVLFRIAAAQAGETGECLVCKKVFVRERGNRRRTCSDKCRMSLSRMNRRIAKSE
jgi:hypothetical protein